MTGYERHLDELVSQHARRDFAALRHDLSVHEALGHIRQQASREQIIYFYVVDAEERLVGVLPTRRLLVASPEQRLSEVMVSRVVALPQTATVLEACELFVIYRLFAFPVVDAERHLVGVVDINLFTDEVIDMSEPKQADSVFETIGFHVEQLRDASPGRAFRFRFPWLTATIVTGTLCALLTSFFEATIEKTLALAFFLTLVLGLGESVSMQSMAVTIQALRTIPPSLSWFLRTLRRELATAVLLGASSGGVIMLIVWAWRGVELTGVAIGLSVAVAICAACVYGLGIPALLRSLKLDPKIAAGPITLALTDLSTLAIYFSTAKLLL